MVHGFSFSRAYLFDEATKACKLLDRRYANNKEGNCVYQTVIAKYWGKQIYGYIGNNFISNGRNSTYNHE